MTAPARRRPALSSSSSPEDVVRSSVSHDVVFGLVGYAGAGPGWVATHLKSQLSAQGFKPIQVKLSELITDAATKLDFPRIAFEGSKIERTSALQDGGTLLRRKLTDSITAAMAIRKIRAERMASKRPAGRPLAFVLDQLKHPKEAELLRRVYGSSFYLISVICRDETRRRRLRIKYGTHTDEDIERLIERDAADVVSEGQQVRKTLHLGDFFVNNDSEGPTGDSDPLARDLARLVHIVTGNLIVRPNRDERGMHAAWSASLRSSCLSRQVGASLLDADGNLLAVGTNDAPRAGGGLYEEGASPDHRCFKDGGHCRNDTSKEELYCQIYEELSRAGLLSGDASADLVRGRLEATGVRDLIEFSRAVHAEMDALITLARTGHASARNATLYCTTYPCHSCARHIIAAGIREVVYVEPYPKSMTAHLHRDAIADASQSPRATPEGPALVRFRLFSGVAPRRFASLFEEREELKRDGRLVLAERGRARHRDPVLDKSFLELEEKVAGIAEEAERRKGDLWNG
ncbi:MAG: hypothetical protein IT372_36810 [Polyangiaceae bacterium]|nr:hypothetical protein [Polyangiaceae bacterium]